MELPHSYFCSCCQGSSCSLYNSITYYVKVIVLFGVFDVCSFMSELLECVLLYRWTWFGLKFKWSCCFSVYTRLRNRIISFYVKNFKVSYTVCLFIFFLYTYIFLKQSITRIYVLEFFIERYSILQEVYSD